jgi:hypothetical protein
MKTGGLMKHSTAMRCVLLALAALSFTAALALQSCPRNDDGSAKGFTFFNKAKPDEEKPAAKLLYITGGKLALYSADGVPKPLSKEGQPLIPVTSLDVNLQKGEVALACGGKVGVAPIEPKAAPTPEGEEWHDLRALAGSDAFVSLVRLSPDAATIYAVIYHAGSLDEGYRIITVTRKPERITDILTPKELDNCEPRDIKFDDAGTPYILFYDDKEPASLIYTFSGGKAQRVFSTSEALDNIDLEEEANVPASLAGIYAIDLADYFIQGSELLLPVYLLVEGKPVPEGQQSELIERTEVWNVDIATGQVTKRHELEHDAGKTQSDFSFVMGKDGLYFARLSFADAPEPLAQDESAKPKEGAGADGADSKGGKPPAPSANEEPQPTADAPPTGFALMKLDPATGAESKLMSASLDDAFYGMSLFPEASVCAVLEGTEDKLTLSAYSFAGEKLQSGIAIDAPVIQYLPVS